MEFAISLPKLVWLPRNKKQTYWLNSKPQMWTYNLTLALTLTLNFEGHMEFAISRSKMVWLPWNKKQTYWLNSKPQIWPLDLTLAMTLTLNFQGQIRNLLYLGQKWSDCHETKSQHIDWMLSLKCDHQIWPWRDLDLEFSRSNMESAISMPKMSNYHQKKKQTYRLNSKPQMWPSDLTLAMTSAKDCHKMKSMHIEWTEGLNDHQVWPWPWPWKVWYKDLLGDFRCRRAVNSSS